MDICVRYQYQVLLVLFFLIAQSEVLGNDRGKVKKIIYSKKDWTPGDYNFRLKKIEKMGDRAVPFLAEFLEKEKTREYITNLCYSLQRAPGVVALEPLKSYLKRSGAGGNWQDRLNRGLCAQAYGLSLGKKKAPLTDSDLKPVLDIMLKDRDCTTRQNVAEEVGKLRIPELRSWFLELLKNGKNKCERKVGLQGVAGSDPKDSEIGELIVNILKNSKESMDMREKAAYALSDFPYQPARMTLIQILEGTISEGNMRAACLKALGHIGRKEDIALLKKAIKRDKYGPGGNEGTTARKSIRKIKKRFK